MKGLPHLGLFAVALAVRLVYLAEWHDSLLFSVLLGDGRQYDAWAREIAGGDWFGKEVFYQAPLYPYFLAAVYALGGPSLWAVRIVQAILGSLAPVLVARAGGRFFSARAGLAAGALLALYPPAIYFDGLVQKGVLDGLFMALLLWCLGEFAAAPRPRWLFVAGATLGAFALTRENALLLPPLIVAWLLVRGRDEATHRRAGWIGLFLLGVTLALAPVGLRNRALGGTFLPTTSQLGPNLYIGNNPEANGRYVPLVERRGSPRHERADATELARAATGRPLDPAEVSRYWVSRALDWVRADPAGWLRLMAKKCGLVWHAQEILDTESLEAYEDESHLLRLLGRVAHFGALLPLALAGVWLTRADWRRLWLLWALALALAGAVALFYVMARYRYPLVPILVLFAGAGLCEAEARLRRGEWRTLLPALVLSAIVAVPCNWPLRGDVDPRTITHFSLGSALVESGHHDAGRQELERALARDPHFTDARWAIGDAWLRQGDPQRAAAEFERALAEDPGHAHAQTGMGMALLPLGRLDEAARHFREAIRLDPRMAAAHNNLAAVLLQQGDAAQATTHLREAVRAAPGDPDLRLNLAQLLLLAGDVAGAGEQIEQALDLDPRHADARRLAERLGIHAPR